MSNNSSSSALSYGGDEYNRILAGIPLEEDSSSDFFLPARPMRNTPLAIPRPNTPRFLIDLSPYGQRFEFEQWSPPVIMHLPFRYAEMTQSEDSGYSSHQEPQMLDWHHVSPAHNFFQASPISPNLPRRQFTPRELFPSATSSLSTPRRVQPHDYLNPADISPDMFSQTTPRPISLRVRNDLFPVTESQSSFSPNILQLIPHHPTSEHDILIEGEIINTSECSEHGQSNEMEWRNDGNDDELNMHMDIYEGWGEDFEEINELIVKNII